MLQLLNIKIIQFLEVWKEKGFRAAWRCAIYVRSEAIPVVRDLSTLKAVGDNFAGSGLELIEITERSFAAGDLTYPIKSRGKKAARNLKKGYRAFALIEKGRVVGDIWFVTPQDAKVPLIHPDLRLLNLGLEAEDVYMFDMFIASGQRGKAIANAFMGNVLVRLRDQGRRKAYGYFEADNIPALWVHRLLGYRELPRLSVRRVLFFQAAKPKA